MFRWTSKCFDNLVEYTVVMDTDFSQTAALLSDPGRAAMLMALIDGTALPAGRLAIIGNISPQTASSHLSKLLGGRLLSVEHRGRQRYYRIANTEVADAIEALLAISPRSRNTRQASTPSAIDENLAFARTCYSHLAGRLGVEITEALLARHILIRRREREFSVTNTGREWLAELGLELTKMDTNQLRFARGCIDWTERRYHLAGKLGSMMLNRFRELKWLAPTRSGRTLRVTLGGENGIYKLLHIDCHRCRSSSKL